MPSPAHGLRLAGRGGRRLCGPAVSCPVCVGPQARTWGREGLPGGMGGRKLGQAKGAKGRGATRAAAELGEQCPEVAELGC